MARTDMNVQVTAFYGIVSKIQGKVELLERISKAMSNNLSRASIDFNSVNFERANEVVNKMQGRMSNTLDKVEYLKRYLNELQDCVEEYLSLKCR